MKFLYTVFFILISIVNLLFGQANNEFYNNGALVFVASGAEIHVKGDVHNIGGTLFNDGLLVVQGNLYGDNSFQQRGIGTTRIINSTVNIGQAQFISGGYAVRGGQSQIGVDDGSFYNLELCNDVGIVWLNGSGNVADVRNSIDFNGVGSPVVNRIITHDPTALPGNGDAYDAVFGIMNPNGSLLSMLDNTVTTNGNMSATDNGYVQGKLRRAVSPLGGNYGFVLGLQPGGITDQVGLQYANISLGINDYDFISGFFMTGLDNTIPGYFLECNGFAIDYFGGTDHGQWVFEDMTATGSGDYELSVWPQDHNMPAKTVWFITKNNGVSGTADECGPSLVGLSRSSFNGFSQFGVAGATDNVLSAELINIWSETGSDFITVNWNVSSESNLNYYLLERSSDGNIFDSISILTASGSSVEELHYSYQDYTVDRNVQYYYRYKTMDYDGTTAYSPIVTGRLTDNISNLQLDVYPNPAVDEITLLMKSDQVRFMQINVYNGLGQTISQSEMGIPKGTSGIPIEITQLSKGVYVICLEDLLSGITITKRFIKQ